MGVSALGLGYEKLRGLQAGFEADVALPAEEGFVAPVFGQLHGLMDTFFVGDEVLLGGLLGGSGGETVRLKGWDHGGRDCGEVGEEGPGGEGVGRSGAQHLLGETCVMTREISQVRIIGSIDYVGPEGYTGSIVYIAFYYLSLLLLFFFVTMYIVLR